MLNVRHGYRRHSTTIILVGLLTACGSQTVQTESETAAPRAIATTGTPALEQCQSAIDGKVYSRVIAAKEVSFDLLRAWYRTRNSGPYSPSQIARIPDAGSVVVCALEAPGSQLKGAPQLTPASTSSTGVTESPAAIVLLNFGGQAQLLDTLGPEPIVTEMMAKLG